MRSESSADSGDENGNKTASFVNGLNNRNVPQMHLWHFPRQANTSILIQSDNFRKKALFETLF